MSFKELSSNLVKEIKSVETVENQRVTLRKDFEVFQKVEGTEELQKCLKLEKWVDSDEFKRKKAEIEALEYKGSREFNQINELKKLEKSSKIKKYFKVADTSNLNRFNELKDSDKIEEYDKLLEYMKEGQFEKEKKEIKSQVFKGSVEERHWLDFKRFDKSAAIKAYKELNGSDALKKHEVFADSDKLKNFVKLRNAPERDKEKRTELKGLKRDVEIKTYFKLEKSKKLMLYKETAGSHDLKRYNELKAYVETAEFKERETFLNDKKKFERSEAYQKQSQFKKLASDGDVKFVLKYEKSRLYKNYLDVKDSFDLKRCNELKEIVSSKEFSDRKAFLEDKNRWTKTEEYASQQDFLRMKELPHLAVYFKYRGTSAFSIITDWELTFEDNFTTSELDNEKWSNVAIVAEKMLGDNYSMPGDLHVFNNGKNVKTGGNLSISVKKEKKEGKVWKMPAGFVPVEFDYTSDLVTTGKNFWQKDGIFEAKIKFNPLKEIVSSLYLSGENNTPRINVMEMGTQNSMGISTLDGSGKIANNGLDISNIKEGKYIFTVEKSGDSLTWKINDTEVFQLSDSSMNFPLQINASSIVVYDVQGSKLPANFEIEWIKCYHKK